MFAWRGKLQAPHHILHDKTHLGLLFSGAGRLVYAILSFARLEQHIAEKHPPVNLLVGRACRLSVRQRQFGKVQMGGAGTVAENQLVIDVPGRTWMQML